MLGWSFSIGRVFGVEVRLHAFFLLLLALSIAWSTAEGLMFPRGLALWLLLLLAVAVREIARALAAAWFSLDLRGILLLPTGGIFTYANPDSLTRAASPRIQHRMALVGPAASFVFSLVLAAIILAISPNVDLYSLKWVTPAHLLRTLVWVNLLLGAVNLLPAWPLDAGRVMRSQLASRAANSAEPAPEPVATPTSVRNRAELARLAILRYSPGSPRIFATLGPIIALVLVVSGLLSVNWWFIMAGIAIFLGAQIERQGLLLRTDLDQVLVRDIMLTDFSVLSASSTLEDALERSRHSLQDVFPVVRGGQLVGAIGRHTILENIQISGNGYIQGLMTRTFPTAAPAEPIIQALSRFTGPNIQSAQLVPVVEGDRIVGIITPQNLQRSMAILPPRPPARAAASARDTRED
jgi:Zn-dependent protease/predicted transcriptional regulator